MASQRFCTKCGAQLPDGVKFCTKCGKAVSSPGAVGTKKDSDAELSASEKGAIQDAGSRDGANLNGTDAAKIETSVQAAPAAQSHGGQAQELSASPTVPMQNAPAASAKNPTQPIPRVTAAQAVALQPSASSKPTAYRQAPPAPQTPVVQTQVVEKTKKSSVVVAVVIVLLLAITVIAVLFGTGVVKIGNDGEGAQQEQAQSAAQQQDDGGQDQEASDGQTAQSASQSAPAKPEPSRAETALYEKLNSLYLDLDRFDSQIAQTASDFNNNYTSSDLNVRYNYMTKTNDLYEDIYRKSVELSETNVPAGSPNSTAYNEMMVCYQDCLNRTSVILQAWERSVDTSDPSYYKEYILEPITSSNDGSTNMYLKDFDARYPKAKPVMP